MLTHGDVMLRDTARAAFWGAFYETPSVPDWLASRRPSNADQETYAGFGFAPGVREMLGGRVNRSVPQYSYTLTNKEWESSVVVDYKTRKFQKNNDVTNLLANMGRKARAYPLKLATAVLEANTAAAAYDSLAIFHASHLDPGAPYATAQTNLDAATAWTADGAPTDIEMAAAIRRCMALLIGFKDGDGDPFWPGGEFQCVVMVPPQLYEICKRVETVEQLTGPVGNDLRGRFTTFCNPYMTWVVADSTFYVINASAMNERPMVYQVAEDVSLSDDMGGDNDFNTKDVAFGTYGLYNLGYGNWRSIVRFTEA
jgi:phage major head subunit gpT-like protein